MRLNCLSFASLLLLACGPGTGETTDTATDTGTASASATASATGTGAPTTDAPTTGAPTTATPTTATPTTETSSTDGTTATSTDTSSTATGTDTDTALGCEVDADCKLASDCCDCDAVPVGVDVAVCDEDCEQPLCAELGIDAARCRFGVCITGRLSCDASKVACDAAAPPCPPGTVAETSPVCWTGRCVAARHCDVVGTCEQCPEGRVCVQNIAFGPASSVTCEPLPPDCDPAGACGCIGAEVCLDPFTFCTEPPGGGINCECPNC